MVAGVIAVAQQKGGAGKTTLAVHLALGWPKDRLPDGPVGAGPVALIDIDPQRSLSRWFEMRQAALGPDHPGLTVVTVAGWRLGNEVGRIARDHALIVIDSPPHAATEARIAIRSAGLVVVPVQPSPLDIWATRATLDLAKAEKVPAILVLNRVPSRGMPGEAVATAFLALDAPRAQARLGNRAGFAASMAEGRGITEIAPGTIAAREVTKLAREIALRLGGK